MKDIIRKILMKNFYWFLFVMFVAGIFFQSKVIFAETIANEILSKADQARGDVGGIEWKVTIESLENGRQSSRFSI